MSDDYWDRDYSEEFTVTLSWSDWNHLHSLVATGARHKQECEDWPEEELQRDRELRGEFARLIGQASPGNGAEDWPDSMKKAWDETVKEMMEEMDDGQ